MDIDVVVLWVDGADQEWQKEKSKYCPAQIDDSNSANRFRDWGLMKYWFRGIEKFAPWVRTVHFVTWGHLPEFLNVNHPKLHIVKHEDYIPPEWLPTFSANPLEMNMHRIPGLAEHFIFFNDDMFLLQPMKETDFFKNGLPCTQATEIPLGFVGNTQVWQFLAANDLGIINKWFPKSEAKKAGKGKFINRQYHWYDNVRTGALGLLFPQYFTGFKNFHCPAAYCKSTFEEIWAKEPELLQKTSSHKFRDREDVNQWLALWWQVANGRFTPRKMGNCVCMIDPESISSICKMIQEQNQEMICINDPAIEIDVDSLSQKLQKAFNVILPEKSEYEKSED